MYLTRVILILKQYCNVEKMNGEKDSVVLQDENVACDHKDYFSGKKNKTTIV